MGLSAWLLEVCRCEEARWSRQKAQQFLKDVPFPRSKAPGVVMRMPANWRMNRLRTPAGEGNVAGKGPNGGSNVVWNTGGDGNARSTAQLALRLPGNPAACYRSSRSRVHLRNVDSIMRRDRNDL